MAPQKKTSATATAASSKKKASSTVTRRTRKDDIQISVADQEIDNILRSGSDEDNHFIPIQIENRRPLRLRQNQQDEEEVLGQRQEGQEQGRIQQQQVAEVNVFDPMAFQTNLMNFLEDKFDRAEEKRERDNSFIKSQMKTMKNKNTYDFKSTANRIQYNFTQDLFELNNDAKVSLDANDKNGVSTALGKIENELLNRQKIIRLADRSVAGWESVSEYLPDELLENGDDDKWRRAEGRAISNLKRRLQTDGSSHAPAKRSFYQQNNQALPQVRPQQWVHLAQAEPQQQQVLIPLQQRPFLWQGAIGDGTGNNQLQATTSQPRRFSVPLNVCFSCGETGHWKHQCPKRTTTG